MTPGLMILSCYIECDSMWWRSVWRWWWRRLSKATYGRWRFNKLPLLLYVRSSPRDNSKWSHDDPPSGWRKWWCRWLLFDYWSLTQEFFSPSLFLLRKQEFFLSLTQASVLLLQSSSPSCPSVVSTSVGSLVEFFPPSFATPADDDDDDDAP